MTKNLSVGETVARLESGGFKVEKYGRVYRAQCPAHNGEGLSLAVSEGENGKVLTVCHSRGCTHQEVMQALGVEKEKPVFTKTTQKKQAYGKTVHPTVEKAVTAAMFGVGTQQKPNIFYRYDNIDGSENFRILRWDTENGKTTRPVSKVTGGYICGTKTDEAYPIYRLPQIAESLKTSNCIFVCEGEKAVNAAVSAGLPATTSAFGSKSATKTDWAALDKFGDGRKLEIVILPDNDEPGRKYAETLVGIFSKFESKPVVKIVSLADFGHVTGIDTFPEGGDFHDLLELLDSKTGEEIRGMLEKMIEETESDAADSEGKLEWEPFPVDLLPESIARLCRESSQAKNVEPVYIGIGALAAVASVIGSAYKIEVKERDWIEPAILWTCLVAESGSGKSPGFDSAIEPLRALQKDADKEYENKLELYVAEREQYDLEYDDWKKARKKRPDLMPPVQPIAPSPETFLVDDATLEAVAEVLQENPFGILLFKDELAGWLRSFDCYRSGGGGKDLPAWLSIHGGRMFRINRKTGPKVIRSNNPAVSICGGIQPMVLQRIVNDNEDFFESGLTARILFAMPPDKPTYWTEATTSDEALSGYENIFRTFHRWRSATNAPSPENPLIVRLSAEAKDLFVRFYNSNADERTELQGDMKAAWAKFAGYAARLALVFHLVERIDDDKPMDILPGDAMQRAIRLVLWFKREAARILQLLRNTKCEIDFESKEILDTVEQNGGTITLRDLQHRRNKYRSKEGSKNVIAMLDSLVRQGKLVSTSAPSGNGKEVVSYSLP